MQLNAGVAAVAKILLQTLNTLDNTYNSFSFPVDGGFFFSAKSTKLKAALISLFPSSNVLARTVLYSSL
jgi:hypothetical protein